MNKVKERLRVVREAVRVHMHQAKVASRIAAYEAPKGISNRFNKLMTRHRTKINMLTGFAAFVIAGFFVSIIVGFIVLGAALFLTEWLSGGN